MQDITVSLSDNVLKVSIIENKEFKGVSADVTKDVVDDNRILNNQEFAVALKELISAVTDKKPRNLALNILIEPNDVLFKFVTVNKHGGEIEDQIINEVKTKDKDFPLEEMYFSYQKIAPFVYQFIGVKKEVLDSYLEVATLLEMSLKCVIPWTILLPRFTNKNEPAIYISKVAGKQVVVLSEFNGVFFSGIYEEDKSTKELQKIVQELSVFKRSDPINKVYIYNYDNFSLNPDYQVLDIEIPNSDLEEAKGYEMHLLQGYMKDNDKDILTTQVNLLNLLPVPVVVKERNMALVYSGAASLILLLGLLIGGGILMNRSRQHDKDMAGNNANKEVLSEDTQVNNQDEQNQPQPAEKKLDLKQEDLTLRIENGAGIPGVAGRTETFLSEKGYVVDSIGNANEVGLEQTLIRIKPDKSSYKDLLLEDMKQYFDAKVQEDLPADSAYDALIIVGTDAKI